MPSPRKPFLEGLQLRNFAPKTEVVLVGGAAGGENVAAVEVVRLADRLARSGPSGRPRVDRATGPGAPRGAAPARERTHLPDDPFYPSGPIRVRSRASEKKLQGRGRGQVVWQVQVLNQDGRVVQEGVTATLVETVRGAGGFATRPAPRTRHARSGRPTAILTHREENGQSSRVGSMRSVRPPEPAGGA